MTEQNTDLTEPFSELLNIRQLKLDSAVQELEEYKDTVNLWPTRKRRFHQNIIKPMDNWITRLRANARPFKNRKTYKKEKKKLFRVKHLWLFHKNGFIAKSQLTALITLNILRILLIFGFFITLVVAIVYGLIKIF
jgi:hypothetical protein